MPRQYSSEKSGFLRLHHRMARKQASLAGANGSSLRFTLTIAAQKARLTFLNHEVDEKGERLLRQAISSAQRKGIHTVELDLTGLRASEQAIDLLAANTRAMLRHNIEFSVMHPDPLPVSNIETFETPKFDASLITLHELEVAA